MGLGQWINNNVHLPFGIDLGVGEALGGMNTYSANIGGHTVTGQAKTYSDFLKQAQQYAAKQPSQPVSGDTGTVAGGGGAAGGGGGGTGYTPDDVSFLNDQEASLRALLARTDTGLAQGLQKNEDDYNTNVDQANHQKGDLVTEEDKGKQGAYDTIDRNANTGYRSLAQIIGRAAGTGSSAFMEALPDAVGKDTSSKRQNATTTHDDNISKIDQSFEGVLADYLKQKKDNESNIRTQVEQQRQGIEGQLADTAGKRAQAAGGGYAAVKAAQAPADAAIQSSKNSVENFFNTFRTPFTPQAVTADRAGYNTDRSVINANVAPEATDDPSNPYSALLKKRLSGAAA